MLYRWLALALILFSFQPAKGQQISLTANEKPIAQILSRIEREHGVKFAYNVQHLKGQTATISSSNTGLRDFLNQILSPSGLVFDEINTGYFVIQKAESVYVQVRVYDQMSLENLPYATIRLKDSNLGAVTDKDGEAYMIVEKPVGAILEFSFLGYETIEMPVDASGRTKEIAVGLTPITTSLGGVEVKEYLNRGIVSDDMASSFTIKPQEMEILPGLVERDPLLSAQMIAGVSSNGETATRLNVRGSSPENTFIYWNNIPVYQSGHYFGTISSFIPSSIGQIDVFKNFIPIEYSGASAGMVKMESRTALNGLTNFEGSLNMTHGDFYAKFPFKKDAGAIMASVRRSYNDLISTPTFEAFSDKLFRGNIVRNSQGGVTTSDALNTDLRFSDINLKWIFEPNSRTNWSVSAFHSSNNLKAGLEESISGNVFNQNGNTESYGLNGSLEYRVKDNWSTNLSLSYSDYSLSYSLVNQRNDEENEEEDEANDDAQNRSNKLKNIELRWNNSFQLKSNQILNFGYQFNYLDVFNQLTVTSFLEEDADELNDSNGHSHSLFGELNWDINDRTELILGTRFNYFSTLQQFKVSPQVRVNYRLSQSFVAKASFGVYDQYVRAIEETENTLSNSIEQHWLLADEEQTVPLTTNSQFVVGFLYQNSGWLVDLDLYQKDISGILARNQGFNVANQAGFSQGSEVLRGLDLTLRKRWRRFRTWVSYNFQDSEARINEFNNNNPFPSSLNIKHQLQISSTLNLDPVELSIGYTYKSGLPVSSVNGINLVQGTSGEGDDDEEEEEDDDDDDETPQDFYQIEYNPNQSRLGEYHRVDLSAWFKIRSNRGWNGEIGLSLINVFDRLNRFNTSYSVELDQNNQPITVQRDRFLLGFTPNLSIRFNF